MDLHDKIKVIRLSKNYTQSFLADELEIDVTNYSRLERGESSISVDRLRKIAKILEVSTSFLLNDIEDERSNNTHILNEILGELRNIKKQIER